MYHPHAAYSSHLSLFFCHPKTAWFYRSFGLIYKHPTRLRLASNICEVSASHNFWAGQLNNDLDNEILLVSLASFQPSLNSNFAGHLQDLWVIVNLHIGIEYLCICRSMIKSSQMGSPYLLRKHNIWMYISQCRVSFGFVKITHVFPTKRSLARSSGQYLDCLRHL